jgi:hypothetical protein
MTTVDYAERVRDTKLPEPTESELTNILSLTKAGRTQSFLEGSLLTSWLRSGMRQKN